MKRNFSWRPDGPFQRHFRDQLEANFFGSRFERFGTSLLIAMRPWVPEMFRKMQRRPAQKVF
jgi:hypothetical protein